MQNPVPRETDGAGGRAGASDAGGGCPGASSSSWTGEVRAERGVAGVRDAERPPPGRVLPGQDGVPGGVDGDVGGRCRVGGGGDGVCVFGHGELGIEGSSGGIRLAALPRRQSRRQQLSSHRDSFPCGNQRRLADATKRGRG